LLLGEYGRTPIPVNEELQQRVSSDAKVIDCRPADLIDNELETIKNKLADAIDEHSLEVELNDDNILIFAMFPEIGLQFLKNINNPEFFEDEPLSFRNRGNEGYSVNVNGEEYVITINPLGEIEFSDSVSANTSATNPQPTSTSNAQPINAQLGGNIFKVLCKVGDVIALDQTVLILEAMKMETEVKSPFAGTITSVDIKEGDAVTPGQLLLTVG
jgi:oxaloacetate decarboxylase alpha subunit